MFSFLSLRAFAANNDDLLEFQKKDFLKQNSYVEKNNAIQEIIPIRDNIILSSIASEVKKPSNALLYYLLNTQGVMSASLLQKFYQKNIEYQFIYFIKNASYPEARNLISAINKGTYSKIIQAQFLIYSAELQVRENGIQALNNLMLARINAPATNLDESALRRKIIFKLNKKYKVNLHDVREYKRLFSDSVYASKLIDTVKNVILQNYNDYAENLDEIVFLLSYFDNYKKIEFLSQLIIQSILSDDKNSAQFIMDNLRRNDEITFQDPQIQFLNEIRKSLSCLDNNYSYNLSALTLDYKKNRALFLCIAAFYKALNDIMRVNNSLLTKCDTLLIQFDEQNYVNVIDRSLQDLNKIYGF